MTEWTRKLASLKIYRSIWGFQGGDYEQLLASDAVSSGTKLRIFL